MDEFNFWVGPNSSFTWADLDGIDLWSIDGFGEYFDSAEKLNVWISNNLWKKHPTLNSDQWWAAMAYGDNVVNSGAAANLNGYEQSEYFLRKMDSDVYTAAGFPIEVANDPILNKFFFGGREKLEKLISSPAEPAQAPAGQNKIPWWLVGIAALYLWRK